MDKSTDKLIIALLKLPEDRKLEIVNAILKDIKITNVGTRWNGNGYRSILFFNEDNIDDPIFELVTKRQI